METRYYNYGQAGLPYHGMAATDPLRIHLSQRAVEWITKADAIYGVSHVYTMQPEMLACPTPFIIPFEGIICGVEDVRAIYQGKRITIYYRSKQAVATGNWYKKGLLNLPTCSSCNIILDWAWEHCLPKRP